jgi:hypothetical protein
MKDDKSDIEKAREAKCEHEVLNDLTEKFRDAAHEMVEDALHPQAVGSLRGFAMEMDAAGLTIDFSFPLGFYLGRGLKALGRERFEEYLMLNLDLIESQG